MNTKRFSHTDSSELGLELRNIIGDLIDSADIPEEKKNASLDALFGSPKVSTKTILAETGLRKDQLDMLIEMRRMNPAVDFDSDTNEMLFEPEDLQNLLSLQDSGSLWSAPDLIDGEAIKKSSYSTEWLMDRFDYDRSQIRMAVSRNGIHPTYAEGAQTFYSQESVNQMDEIHNSLGLLGGRSSDTGGEQ